jgi:multiple antibiotic resistance protein
MSSFLHSLLMTFVPLFIVIDALGSLLFIWKASTGLSPREQRKMSHVSILTATVVGLVFLFFGQLILKAMSISVSAFTIAGGIILLVLAIRSLVTGQSVEPEPKELTAMVPIGTPLLAGPATITTLLLLANRYPLYIVLISFLVNLLITWIIFLCKNGLVRIFGEGGLKAVSNIFNLLLAAIAVSMILTGLNMPSLTG